MSSVSILVVSNDCRGARSTCIVHGEASAGASDLTQSSDHTEGCIYQAMHAFSSRADCTKRFLPKVPATA
jgi:hypothetical protein